MFGENFPYSNFHDLNMDWIIKVVKDFLTEYRKKYEEVYEEIKLKMTSDEEIQEAIEDYIERHPIVNIPDFSIQIRKFALGILGYVIPEMFGAVGDGITDDTTAFTNMIDFSTENKCNIYIPEGSYKLSETLFTDGDVEVKVNNNAVFPDEQIFYKTPNNFTINKLENYADLNEPEISNNYERYNEAMCYDSNRNLFYSVYYQFNESTNKTLIAVIDADTLEVQNTYQYNIKPVQTIAYNTVLDKIYVTDGEFRIFELNPENMGSSPTEITLSDGGQILLFDEVKKCCVTLAYNANDYLRINVFTADLSEILYTVDVDISNVTRRGLNGCCAYNGKVYQVWWYSIIEVDITSGEYALENIFSQLEPEGVTGMNGDIIVTAHNLYTITGNPPETRLFRYNKNTTPALYKSYFQDSERQAQNKDLNTILDEGYYTVNKTVNDSLNYPSTCTKGFVKVEAEFSREGRGHEYIVQTFTDLEHNHTVWRRQAYVFTNTFTEWEQIPIIKRKDFSGTTDSTWGFLDTGLDTTGITITGVFITSGSNLIGHLSQASGDVRVQAEYGTDLTMVKNISITGYVTYYYNI